MTENDNLDEKPMSDEEIDENLDESFPASDPPSWNLGTGHGKENSKPETDEKASDNANNHFAM